MFEAFAPYLPEATSATTSRRAGWSVAFAGLCREAGLPAPEINRYILLGDEYHKVDFFCRQQRVVIEVDSRRYHSTGWQRRRDAERDALLVAHGYDSARVSEEDLDQRPQRAVQTAATLIDALHPAPTAT